MFERVVLHVFPYSYQTVTEGGAMRTRDIILDGENCIPHRVTVCTCVSCVSSCPENDEVWVKLRHCHIADVKK